MQIIKIQAISEDEIDVEGAIEGADNYYIENSKAFFIIESKKENKIIEIIANKVPFWNFSVGPYQNQLTRNPNWKNNRKTVFVPLLTEVLEIEVPDDAVLEYIK